MKSNARTQIQATADQFGWTSTKLAEDWIEYTKPVAMINQRDEYRVVVLFHESGLVAQAYYGSDLRPKTFSLPVRASVRSHLMKWGPHHV